MHRCLGVEDVPLVIAGCDDLVAALTELVRDVDDGGAKAACRAPSWCDRSRPTLHSVPVITGFGHHDGLVAVMTSTKSGVTAGDGRTAYRCGDEGHKVAGRCGDEGHEVAGNEVAGAARLR